MNLHQAWTNKKSKPIKTTKCPKCNNQTLSHYKGGVEVCGFCMTFSYPIKTINKEKQDENITHK